MSSDESLHDTYLKAKRYLVFFSGALLLSVFVGFAASEQNALLGWKISDPHLVSVVLYFAVGYYLAQLALFWDAQPQPAKVRLQHSFDYWLSVAIGFIALYSLPVRLTLHPLGMPIQDVEPTDLLLQWPTVASLAVLPVVCAVPYRLVLRPSIKKNQKDVAAKEVSTTDLILANHWRLVFNPTLYSRSGGAQGSKEIVFQPDGSISEGRNDNEYSWRVNAGFLEILKADGKTIQSRFKVEDNGERLQHTNESDTVSLRDQYLVRRQPVGPILTANNP